jgi:hypothetical protein
MIKKDNYPPKSQYDYANSIVMGLLLLCEFLLLFAWLTNVNSNHYFSNPLTLTPSTTLPYPSIVKMNSNKIDWKMPPEVTPGMKWQHLAETIQEAYNEFKRGWDEDSLQVTLFYYKFKDYEIKPGQPDRTPKRRRKERGEVQIKLFKVI